MSDEIGIGVAITGDPSGGVAALKTVEDAGNEYEAAILRIAQNVTVGLDSVVRKLDDLGKAHKEAADKAKESSDGLADALNSVGKKFEDAFSLKALLGEMASGIVGIIGPVALLGAGLEAVKEVFSEIVDFSKEGIGFADQFRDLGLTLSIIEGGARQGGDAYQYFEQRLDHTRDTAKKLSEELIRMEPLLTARHFNTSQQEETILQLSQLATIKPEMGDMDSMISGYQRILMGSASGSSTAGGGRNPLLKALGITSDQMTGDLDDTVQLVRTKLAEMTSHFDEFGDSVKSTIDKAKDALLVDFAEGFNGARGNAAEGMEAIKALVADPEVKDAFVTLGRVAADAFAIIGAAIENATSAFAAFKGLADSFGQGGWLDFLGAAPGVLHMAALQLAREGADSRASATAADQLQRGQDVTRAYGIIPSNPGDTSGAVHAEGFQFGADQFIRTVGEISKTATKDQLTAFFADIQGRIAKSGDQLTVIPADLVAAAQDVFGKPLTKIKTGAPGKDAGEDDTTAADTKAVNEQIQAMGELARLKDQQISQDEKLAILNADGNKLSIEHITNDANYDKQWNDLMTKKEQALLRWKDDVDKGDFAAADAQNKIIDGLELQVDGLGAVTDKQNALVDANYWKKLADQEITELNNADAAMNQFVAKTKDKLAEMPVAVADAARAAFAANKAAMDQQMTDLFALAGASGMTPGFGTSLSPEAVKAIVKAIADAGKQANEDSLETAKERTKLETAGVVESEKKFIQTFDSDFTAIIESGGHNFVSIIASGFKQTVSESVKMLADAIVGSPGDPKKSDASGGPQLVGHMYDQSGHDISLSLGSQVGQYALAGAGIAATGYSAGLSGQSGSRTGSAIGAGISAYELSGGPANPYSPLIALAAAAVSEIFSAIGAAARQADYQYGIPTISPMGVAGFQDQKNYTADAAIGVVRQIQAIYDNIHDSLALVLIKAAALVPLTQGIVGQFQPNPSGHFGENLAAYEANTLPTDLINQVRDPLTTLAGTFGMSADRFNAIWAALQNLDPTKVVTLIASLMDSEAALQTVSAISHAQNPLVAAGMVTGKPGDVDPFTAILQTIQGQAMMTPGQTVAQQDQQILKLEQGLVPGALSPEGQINALAQINQLVQARYQTEIQLAQQLFALVKQIDASAESSTKNYQAMQILKPDGTPDQYGLAQFYKKQADQDLRDVQNAKTATDLSAAYAKFTSDIQAAVQAGSAQDPTQAGKIAWAQYGIDSTALGKGIADQMAIALGATLNPEQTAFNAQFDPIMTLFQTGIGKMFGIDPVTGQPVGNPGGGGDPGTDPFQKMMTAGNNLATAATAPIVPLQTFATVVTSIISQLNAAMSVFVAGNVSIGDPTGTATAQFLLNRRNSQAA